MNVYKITLAFFDGRETEFWPIAGTLEDAIKMAQEQTSYGDRCVRAEYVARALLKVSK